ncbi:MAG: hypothetical protein QF719_05215 [Chloroflexota bacterium]|nr:hypothetical protein [Chloroflexota bacterium]MDP6757598.1 hypothetical protein [Chloroflexota bacterium]
MSPRRSIIFGTVAHLHTVVHAFTDTRLLVEMARRATTTRP